jgi:predicted ATP-grasp superfamily ATP-dependent carboligase
LTTSRTPPVPFDTSVAAIVVKLRHSVIHHGGLGAIRSLGRLGIPVYAVHEGWLAPPAASRYLSGGFVWEPGGDPEQLFEGLASFVERLGGPAVLVPTDDAAAVFIAEHAAELAGRFLVPRPPAGLPRTVASKRELYRLCTRLGVPCPKAVAPTSRAQVEAFLEGAVFPVVVKGAEPWLLPVGAGVRSTTIVRTPDDLLDLFARVEGHQATALLFQEYIPPDAGQDWFFHGYCDDASDCLVGFTGRKLRSYPAHAGPTSLGSWEPNDELARQAQELFRAVSYRGIMDLDYRLDRRDGRYKLLDFNPRVGAQFRLFEDDQGIDVVRAMHLDLTGRAVPAGRPRPGRRFVVENHDPLASLAYRRRGELTVGEWGRSLAGVREAAWFAPDDLRPFLMVGARALLRRALWRRRSRSPGDGSAVSLHYVPGRRARRVPTAPPTARAVGDR